MEAKTLTVKIEKVGRKWIHCKAITDGYKKNAKLCIDDTTKYLQVGDEIKNTFEISKTWNRYFRNYDWTLRMMSDYEIKEKEHSYNVKKMEELKKRVLDFLGYIEKSIDKYSKPYWYNNGEETVKDLLKKLEIDFDEETKEFRKEAKEELERLRNDYIGKKESNIEEKKQNIIHVVRFTGPYKKGTIVERDGKYYKIFRTRQGYEPDALSLGGWIDNQMMYGADADCRGVSEKEIEEFKLEKAEKEKKLADEKTERERINALNKAKDDALNKVVTFIRKEGTLNSNKISISEIEKDGKIILNTFTIYGGGREVIIKDDVSWLVINNGHDGDFWGINTIYTGGAGAYGYYCENTDELKELVEKFESIVID